jgi:hypothetical protein
MLNKDNIEIIYPGIMVFRNGIKNAVKIVEQLSKYQDWEKWYDIGEQILFNPMAYHRFEHFPTLEEWRNSRYADLQNIDKQATVIEELKDIADVFEEIFFESTQHYVNHYQYKLPNWLHNGSNILRYEGRMPQPAEVVNKNDVDAERDKYNTTSGTAGSTKEMTLPFHTDFYQNDALEPGLKAEYTVTMYLNEDYDGGEIDFRIFNGTDQEMRLDGYSLKPLDLNYGEVPKVMYKPQAGDVIIFPSRPPFYHGVRRVTSGSKYFVRMFWMSILE